MFKLYHTTEIKQELKLKKSPITIGFPQKDSQVAYYNGDIYEYTSRCTPLQKKIADIFLGFRYSKKTKITNDHIAQTLNCSTKTVTRSTNKFHRDGFITKYQDNPYAPNHYKFNAQIKRGKHAYDYWFNSQSYQNQDLFVTHGIRIDHKNKLIYSCENVPQNNNRYLSSKLYLKKPKPSARARAKETVGFFYKQVDKSCLPELTKDRTEKITTTGRTMKQNQKAWILSNKSDPRIKEMLITKPIERLAQLLSLDERERLKLIAFTDEALEYTFDCIEPIVTGKRPLKVPVRDRMGWLISIAHAFCKKNSLTPDWPWYFEICEIIGMKHVNQSSPKPLVIEKKENKSNYMYKKWEEPKSDPIDITINKLRQDIIAMEQNSTLPFMASLFAKSISLKKEELADLEKKIAVS